MRMVRTPVLHLIVLISRKPEPSMQPQFQPRHSILDCGCCKQHWTKYSFLRNAYKLTPLRAAKRTPLNILSQSATVLTLGRLPK